jgi:hypothetical protein
MRNNEDEVAFELKKIIVSQSLLSPIDHHQAAGDVELALQQTDFDLSKSNLVVVVSPTISP